MRVRTLMLSALLLALASCAPRPPQWIAGPSEQYPVAAWFTGVGIDTDRVRAEDRARAEIAKIFEVQVHARDVSSESHWLSRTEAGASEEYRQQVAAELSAGTDRVLSGVRIAEVWTDKGGRVHALAVLDRLRAAQALRGELAELDLETAETVRRAEAQAVPLRRLGGYLQALQLLERRRPLAGDLALVDPSGIVPAAPYGAADISSRADAAAADIRLGVELDGDRDRVVQGALIRALAEVGFRLAPAGEADLLLRGGVTMESYAVAPLQWAVATAQVEFVGADGAPLDAVRASVREGSQVAGRAETLAREKLGERLASLLLERFEKGSP
jgi:hypothetical protein